MASTQASEAEEPDDTGRALVALAAPAPLAPRPQHPQASFLAHLIATAQDCPQTRARRRAEPAQAVTAYEAMAEVARWG